MEEEGERFCCLFRGSGVVGLEERGEGEAMLQIAQRCPSFHSSPPTLFIPYLLSLLTLSPPTAPHFSSHWRHPDL